MPLKIDITLTHSCNILHTPVLLYKSGVFRGENRTILYHFEGKVDINFVALHQYMH